MKRQKIDREFIRSYTDHLRREEKAEATIEKYIRDISAFSKFVSDRELTKELAVEYKHFLTESNYSLRSINSVIASLNGLFNYMHRYDCKLKTIKIQRQLFCSKDKELTKEEYMRLINAAKKKGNERLSLVIQTICGTGIRVGELEFVTVESVRKGQAEVSLKGKTRTVFIVKELQKKLLGYIAAQKKTTGPVFVTRAGKPICRSNIWKEMKNLCKASGVNPNKVFPHNLRHLFARTFYGIKKDIAKLADILGHSSIETTRIYIVTTYDEHIKCMENMCLII